MVDQSHNLKPKIEAMVQTVTMAQTLYTKAQLVDRKLLARLQKKGDIVGAEQTLRQAYETDVTPILKQWRREKGLPLDPLTKLRDSGVIKDLGKQRKAMRKAMGLTSTASYA